ncbi:CAP domain-containing protein [Nocardioides sp. WV_118_6]
MLRRRCTSLLRGVLGLLVVPVLVLVVDGPGIAATPGPAAVPTVPAVPGAERTVISTLFEARAVTLTNRRRARAGCRPVRVDVRLREAARAHSTAMAQAGRMAHTLPGEPGLVRRMTQAGYTGWRRLAENLAAGFVTPAGAVRAWLASPGHRRNILDCRMREIGVGVVVEGTQVWWTQDFGRR